MTLSYIQSMISSTRNRIYGKEGELESETERQIKTEEYNGAVTAISGKLNSTAASAVARAATLSSLGIRDNLIRDLQSCHTGAGFSGASGAVSTMASLAASFLNELATLIKSIEDTLAELRNTLNWWSCQHADDYGSSGDGGGSR